MTIAERLLALRTTPPFDRLRDSELALIAEVARVRRYSPGEVIGSPEKPLRRLGVLVAGRIDSSHGGDATVLGAETLLFDLPATGHWRAADPEGAVCLLITRGHFHTIARECPALVTGLLRQRP